MTDDFDVSLGRRLEGLAAAVPVAQPGAVTAVVRQPVRARSTGRLALAGLLPVVAVVVIGAVLVSVLKIGPGPADSPAGSTDAANGPIEARTRSGVYELTIRSAKARYAVDDPIDIAASLTFVGEELPGGVQIGHALGANEGPLGFGIEEPVIGDLRLTPGTEDACARTILVPGQPLTTTFAKSAGWSGDDPRSDDYLAFIQDPVLRLGAGTWHVYAVASFSPGDCGPDPVQMRVDLTIEVAGTLATIDGPVVATDSNGDFELTIRSPKGRYEAGEPIAVKATFSYSGDEPVHIHHSREGSPLDFGIAEPVLGDLILGPGGRLPCIGTMLDPGYTETADFTKSASWTSDDPLAPEYEAFARDPELRLAEGTWHVYAVARFSIDECGNPIEMRAELEIDVAASPGPDASASVVPTAEPFDEVLAVGEDGPFRLELRSDRAVYVAGEPIDVRATLTYFGVRRSATDFSGGITLRGAQTDGAHSFVPGPMVDMCVIRPIEDLPIEAALADWPKVRSLPAGRWRITASFSGSAPACTFDGQGIRAWIDITVVPAGEPARTIPLLTATDVEEVSSDRFCRNETLHASGGELSLDPSSGLGLASESGDIQPVRWPPGFSAEVLPDGAILYGASGQIVAREGDLISFPAGIASDGVLSACGQFLFW